MPRNKKGTRSLATYLRRSDMKLPLATGVLLLVLLLGCTSPPKTGPERAVYVANEKGASLSVVDAATNKVVETIALGGHPHNVNVSADGKYFFATNHSEDEEEEANRARRPPCRWRKLCPHPGRANVATRELYCAGTIRRPRRAKPRWQEPVRL